VNTPSPSVTPRRNRNRAKSPRATAEHKSDRTPGTEPAVQMANQLDLVFAKLDCKPRWRERLADLAIPALVVHGRRDPFFPVGNGEALASEIPGARLLVLERAATAIPDAAVDEVAAAMLALYFAVPPTHSGSVGRLAAPGPHGRSVAPTRFGEAGGSWVALGRRLLSRRAAGISQRAESMMVGWLLAMRLLAGRCIAMTSVGRSASWRSWAPSSHRILRRG
jgi:hypothetical protein